MNDKAQNVKVAAILNGLTPEQLAAATHDTGPMLVLAGAGSGKTRVVTARVAWLISQGVKPWQILAMTFTNKAAGEMRARVESFTGEAPQWMGTFHSLCARFLRFDVEALEGYNRNFTIFDSEDQRALVKQIMKDREVDSERFKPKNLASIISNAKCEMVAPEEYGDGSWYDNIAAGVYRDYARRLKRQNALDFDDLLLLTVKLLSEAKEVREKYQRRFRYLLIDEYQDTNQAQYRLMRLLSNEAANVHVTGDPDQSIYSWRGADYSNIMNFQRDFPAAKVVRLERNYRSSGNILKAANQVIQFNPERLEKNLFTEDEDGAAVTLAAHADDRAEALWVAEEIGNHVNQGGTLQEVAILYRTNAQSRLFEEAFLGAGLPYKLIGGVRFYERKEIKDLLAHLKLAVNPRDEMSLRRVVGARPTGVGAVTLEKICAQAAALNLSPFEFLTRVDFASVFQGRVTAKLRDFAYWCARLAGVAANSAVEATRQIAEMSGLLEHISANRKDPLAEERLENIETFLGRAAEFQLANPEADLAQFLEDVALVADVDAFDPEAASVTLMTLHSAKGLEFPVVFLVGLENGLLPHANTQGEVLNEEEERRLFYVGITRAEKILHITHAARRLIWGRPEMAAPSPFLSELPLQEFRRLDFSAALPVEETADEFDLDDDLFVDDDDDFPAADADFIDEFPPPPAPPDTKKPAAAFNPGDLVAHCSYGQGRVLSCRGARAVVQFSGEVSRLLTLEVSQLQKAKTAANQRSVTGG